MLFTGLSICLLLIAADLPASRVVAGTAPISAIVLTLVLAPLFALCQACWLRRWQPDENGEPFARRMRLARFANRAVWLISAVVTTGVLNWPGHVRSWSASRWPLVDELAIVAPPLLAAMLSGLVLVLGERQPAGPFANDGQAATFRLRLRLISGQIAAPLLLLFLLRDLLTMAGSTFESPLPMAIATCLILPVLLVAYPVLAGLVWRTVDLPAGSLQRAVAACCRESGLSACVTVWNTGGMITNALVVGIAPRFRRLVLTDELLRRFDEDEICAIVRHELGHVALGHLWLRLAVLLTPVALTGSAWMWMASESSPLTSPMHASVMTAGAAALCLSWLLVVVIPVFQWTEFQADQFAVRDAHGSVCTRRADDYLSALLRLAMSQPQAYRRGSLFHPPIHDRIARIEQLVRAETIDAGATATPVTT